MGRVHPSAPAARSRGARGYALQPGWRLLAQDLGLDLPAVLRGAGLPADLLSRTEARLEPEAYFALWRGLEAQAVLQAAAAGQPQQPLPLRILKVLSADWFDPVLFAALCSADLTGALDRVARYKRLVCPMTLTVQSSARQTTLTLEWPAGSEPPPVLVAFELAFFVQLGRMATRTAMAPLQVRSPVPLPQPQAYAAFFGVPVRPGGPARLVFSAEDVRRPFLTVNPELWAFFEPALRQRLADLDAEAGTAERLRSVLLKALPAGDVGMASACRTLGLSARTLQRRLQQEGTSFQRTLDAVRHDLAQHYLRQSRMSGAEIAFLLGFEDPGSFVRAFHGWTGQTPEQVRRQGLAGPAGPADGAPRCLSVG